MSQKRGRSINWDEEEKQLFRSVLKEYAQIIENKSLDTNTNKIKTDAWEKVHKKFNELNSRFRDLNQLKIQWKGMKINARKTLSTFKKEVNKTGGGVRPATPDEAVIEVKDLMNPVELLIDSNIYDSDGIIVGNIEPTLIISQENTAAATPIEKKADSTIAKTSEDEIEIIVETHMKTNIGTKSAKKVVKRKLMTNNFVDSCMKPRKDHEGYVSGMLVHTKMLKDEEHLRKMEMADEEHKIKMEIHKENLMSAKLQREIWELKKAREEQ